MILETLLPGGVAFFLGISGLGVGVLRYLGFLSDPFAAIFVWLFSSVALTIAIRPFIRKYFKGETSYKFADEDYEAIDQIVDVVENICDDNNEGRIRFQGISWQARSIEGEIPAGTKARITYPDNTTWIVEPADESAVINQKIKNKNRE